ncbi:hypothetical protein EAE96_006247 [Botrytis aclada]|nr:hypothetical protein EAE96_006247 [Botrytis aclada]
MASPNDIQSSALNNSKEEYSRSITSNTDDDDEMPHITNAMYIAELKQRIVDLEQRNARTVNFQEQMYLKLYSGFFAFLLAFLLAGLLACLINAKT